FVAAVLNKFPPLPYEVIFFSFRSLQPVLMLSAPVAAVVAMLLRRPEREGGWLLLAGIRSIQSQNVVHPDLHNQNLLPFLNGPRTELSQRHAKIRRDGYRRP